MSLAKPKFWTGITLNSKQKPVWNEIERQVIGYIKSNQWDVAISLLENPENWHSWHEINLIEMKTPISEPLLHFAARQGVSTRVVQKLIELGCSRYIRNVQGARALHVAQATQHIHLFDLLEAQPTHDISEAALEQIQKHFYEIMRVDQNGLAMTIVEEDNLRLPQLHHLLEMSEPLAFFRIMGFWGGIEYRLRTQDNPLRLVAHISDRQAQLGDERIYEVTTDGYNLIEPKDKDEKFLLYFKLFHDKKRK